MINMRVGEPPDPFSDPEISGIHEPQHLRSLTQGVVSGVFQPAVMDIYTGCCVFEFSGDHRDPLISLVPLGLHGAGPDVDIQKLSRSRRGHHFGLNDQLWGRS
jgi:hypothetical protein